MKLVAFRCDELDANAIQGAQLIRWHYRKNNLAEGIEEALNRLNDGLSGQEIDSEGTQSQKVGGILTASYLYVV